jgi:hypothetical protein
MWRALEILLVGVALAFGSLGIWGMTTKDVQGGRFEIGVMMLGVAVIAAIAAAALLGSHGARVLRVAMGLALLAIGGPFGLYGLFAFLYRGDGGGSTYVRFSGHEIEARIVGAISLLVAVSAITAAVLLLRRPHSVKPS